MPFTPIDETTQEPMGEQPQGKPLLNKIAGFMGLESTVNNIRTAIESPFLSGEQEQVQKENDELFKRSQELIKQAKNESDPERKRSLLEQSRQVDSIASDKNQLLQERATKFQMDAGITDVDLTRSNMDFATRRGIAMAGEIGAWLIPFSQNAKVLTASAQGGSVLQKMIASGKIGASTAALLGLTAETNLDDASLADEVETRLTRAVQSGLMGGAISAFLTGGFEGSKLAIGKAKKGLGWIKGKLDKRALAKVANISKSTLEEADNLGIDPYQEIFDRDLIDENVFKRTKKVIKYQDGGKKAVYEYGGQEKLNKLINQAEDKIKEAIGSSDPTVTTKTDLRRGLAEFIENQSNTQPEADFALKFVDDVFDNLMPDEKITATQALEIKRKLYEKFINTTAKGSVKSLAGKRIAQDLNNQLKRTLPDVASNLREQQIMMFLRDEVIPDAGRNVYRNAAKRIVGANVPVIRGGIGIGAGGAIAGVPGAIAGGLTQISNIVPSETVLRSGIGRGTPSTPQSSEAVLRALGLIGGQTADRIVR